MDVSREQLLHTSWSGVPVIITGAAGFLGSHLSERLDQLGAKLTLIDDYSNAAIPKEQPVGSCKVLPMHVCSAHLLETISKTQPEVIFHLAGNAYAAGSVINPDKDMHANLESTFQLLDALRISRYTGVFLFVSSAAIYGEPHYLPIDENHPIGPISPYGVSKLAAEMYVSVYANLYGIKAISIRPFSLYGPRQRKQVVYDLITKLRSQEPQILIGDGSETRDFVYVTDAVEAMLTLTKCGIHNGSAYNLCSGVGISIKQLAEEISDLLDSRAPFRFSGKKRPGDPNCWIGSPEKLKQLGVELQMPIRDGLRRTIEWFLETH